ncbi:MULTISPECIES: class I SAM-dependent methyltransferase [unclassified Rhizobium]|jgi:ubiquinone/menaquinone biosynthesis C-methylase UbiE|uniref:class I SAM-dependent methyltransferase n=1 Tax=unclassified Rhizobium TaxID=2613769 RepID=UPI0006477318|nr:MULTISPECIES: class I SAM-dependent methyltransferase [unclassified Rhizobium]MBN8953132.1 class I SAM-dependent methyltransferase [Rhizobium tropici]OJY75746.1 MAG: ubiquinone biosynthesis protein UbiE [Rhizobium sp. 60-20]RKD75037.1 ubiquinone/menaquinone biosynthesis C-methylase UbiE [Rhizobium sp. WW_1]
MTISSDTRFWDRAARKYAKGAIADQAGYERTLGRTLALLNAGDRVLELGCGTGTTALRLAGKVHDYLATDVSAEMIAIARERYGAEPIPSLSFRVATAEAIATDPARFNAVLGFNYLHLIRDLPGTLRHVHHLLPTGGLFISKTPCVGEMKPLIRLALLPAMRAIGKAPHAGVFRVSELAEQISAAGFDILATENHASKGDDNRPYIVARKR